MNKQWIKNSSIVLVCFFALMVYLKLDTPEKVQKEVIDVSTQEGVYRQVVYKDSDNLLIPIAYHVDEMSSLEADVLRVFTLMKDTGTLDPEFSSIIPRDLVLQSSSLNEEGVLNLDFSLALDQIASEDELRFLEGMVFVFSQFEGVEHLTFSMDNESLHYLPSGNIAINQPLGKELGINNFETSQGLLHRTTPVVVYYSKKVGSEDLYVPMTKRIEIDANNIELTVSQVLGEVSVTSMVSQTKAMDQVQLLDGTSLIDGVLTVNLNSNALLDELTIDQNVYDLLILSLGQIEGVDQIMIQVQGEDIQINETNQVSNMMYNIVQI